MIRPEKLTLILILCFVVTLIGAAICYSAINDQSKKKTTLSSLWEEYEAAEAKDKPQTAMSVLDKIKQYALSNRLNWDYYDACQKYYELDCRVNWKNRTDAQSRFSREVEVFNDPVMISYFYLTNYWQNKTTDFVYNYVKENKSVLSATNSPKFLENLRSWSTLSDVINKGDFFKNDYQNLLWFLSSSNGSKEALTDLTAEFDNVYPQSAWLEYYAIDHMNGTADIRLAKKKEFASKYSDKAISLLADQDLLDNRFSDYHEKYSNYSDNVKTEDHDAAEKFIKDLRSDCQKLLDKKKSFKGSEKEIAACCNRAEQLIETLDSKNANVSIKDNELTAVLRNLSSCDVTLVDKESNKRVWKTTLKNPVRSYYLNDTVKVNIPDIDDGDYTLNYMASGIDGAELEYSKYSISVGTRVNDGKYEIFAVDSKSGKPLDSVSGMLLGGYTPLSDDIQKRLEKSNKETFVCEATSPTGKKLLSRELNKDNFRAASKVKTYTTYDGVVLTDCAAFHPGEVVKYKAIAYSVDEKMGEIPVQMALDSKKIAVKVFDPESKEVDTKELVTNDFGSAASEFTIPTDRKNGEYRIEMSYKDDVIACSYITVAEYVLPTFEVIMDKIEKNLFVGSKITFSGKVSSYSGKAISSDKSTYSIRHGRDDIKAGSLDINNDGTFSVEVVADESGYYTFKATIIDATGESKTVSKDVSIYDRVNFGIEVKNFIDAETSLRESDGDQLLRGRSYGYRRTMKTIAEDSLKVNFSHSVNFGSKTPATISYNISREGQIVASGSCPANKTESIYVGEHESGLYKITAKASATSDEGKTVESSEQSIEFLKIKKGTTTLDAPVNYVIIPEAEGLGFDIGTTTGDIWAIVTIVSADGHILKDEVIHLNGKRGEPGSMMNVSYDFDPSWGKTVQLYVRWFKNHLVNSWDKQFNSSISIGKDFPIEFTSFTDMTSPSKKTEFTLKVPVNSEVAVTVYDKSTWSINRLYWNNIYERPVSVIRLQQNSVRGSNSTSYPIRIRGVASVSSVKMSKAASRAPVLSENIELVEEEAIPFQLSNRALGVDISDYADDAIYDEMVSSEAQMAPVEDTEEDEDIVIRDSFDNVIAFEPILYPDADGNVTFSVTPTGKLSTFIVKAYAHDKNMKNNQIDRELVVSIPVELSVVEPQFLYVGDKYVLNASVSATKDVKLTNGTMTLSVIDGTDKTSKPIMKFSKAVKFDKNGLASAAFEIPSVPAVSSGELGLMVTFSGKDANGDKISDGALVSVPVFETSKMMTEGHSAIYKAGMDKAAIISILSSQFTNLSSKDAVVSERKIADMIGDVLSENKEPRNDDAISLMEAIQTRLLSAKLSGKSADCSDIITKLMECRNSDGGFAWRKDMESSQMVTLYILQGAAMLRDKGIQVSQFFDMSSAVKYIDKERTTKAHYWYGSSLEQYCYVRSLYSNVKYTEKPSKDFKEDIKVYLTPKDESYLKGNIISKARRTLTLDNLCENADGIALAKEWGITLSTSRKLSSTRKMDVESVKQYAVEHASGGKYFPNAVMPFRGLMESELYAHTLLCEMFKSEDPGLADDLRLWLMVQKETQEWKSDPTTVLAVAAIMEGSKELLETSVITLTATANQSFKDTKATANGFTVNTKYYRKSGTKWIEVKNGDVLHIGDKVKASHQVHSDENRSFVRMETYHPACLKVDSPVSGRYGWRLYRDVRLSSTQWWWDACAEETTTYEEFFTVFQEGAFQSAASEIECLYSPAWRANENAHPVMKSAFAK